VSISVTGTGYGVRGAAGANIEVNIGCITVGASGTALRSGNTGTVIEARINSIESSNASYVVGASTIVNLIVGDVTGTPTVSGTLNLTQAGYIGKTGGDLNALTAKSTPVSADVLLIEDSAASFEKKKATISSLSSVLGIPIYADVAAAEAASGSDTDLCYVATTDTFYEYVAAGSSYVDDDTFVLSTGDGGNTRWVGVAGKYRNSTGEKPTNGFEDKDSVTLSFVNGSRTLTLTPSSSDFAVWSNGTRFVKTGVQNIVISTTEGIHYVYYDATGTLVETTTFSLDIITTYAIVSIIYWDNTNSKQIMLGREIHGRDMAGDTHAYAHLVFGARLGSGGGLGNFTVDASGDLAAHAQFSCEATELHDEDIILDHSARLLTATLPVYYRDGADASNIWRINEGDSFPVVATGSGRAAWNDPDAGGAGIWGLTEVSNNNFVNAHVFTSNDTDRPFAVIMGQVEYNSISSARAGALVEINDIILAGLPTPEFTFLGTVILQTSDGYANAVQSRIRSTDIGDDYVDLRGSIITRSGTGTTVTDHAGLANLDFAVAGHTGFQESFLTTRGDLLYVNASSAEARLPIGTANQVLTSDGTDVSWATPSGGGGWTAVNVIYVGKHGNDSDAGTDPSEPKLTIGSAVTAATASSSSSDPYVIWVMDSDIYAENIVLTSTDDWIQIYAPNAELNGYIRMEGENQHIKLKRHEGTAAYNSAAIYYAGTDEDKSLEITEGVYTSTTTYVLRDAQTTGGKLRFWCGQMTVTGTSGEIFRHTSSGQTLARVGFIDTQRAILQSLNALGETQLFLDEIVCNSSMTLGTDLFRWSHNTLLEVGRLNMNSRADLFYTPVTHRLYGGFGHIEGYSSTYPIDVSNNLLWGLRNIQQLTFHPEGLDGAFYPVSNSKLPGSSVFNQYVYFGAHIPTDCLDADAWELYPMIITQSGGTNTRLSVKANWGSDNEIVSTHTINNTAYVLTTTSYGATDYIKDVSMKGVFTTVPDPGDMIRISIGAGSGGAQGIVYFSHLKLVYFKARA